MAQTTDDRDTHSFQTGGVEARALPRRLKGIGAEILGYAWASFLIAASGAETALARLLTKRR